MTKKRYAQPPTYYKDGQMADVVINTPYGPVYGSSFFNADDDDPDVASEYLGCQLAEYRARKQYYKLKAHSLHDKYLGAKTVIDASVGGAPMEMINVVNNYYKQWKQARSIYHSMGKNEHDYIQKLVDTRVDWLKRGELHTTKSGLSDAVREYIRKDV